jgi:outer membrane protein OmpA-like peptidoglycan-associated protein
VNRAGRMRWKSYCLVPGVLLAGAAFALTGEALGQTVDRGNDVIVNPVITGGKNTMLLYPGGQYMRVLPPLLEPGEKAGSPIHLHMPTRHQAAREAAVSEQHPAAPKKEAARAPEPKVAAAPKPAREAREIKPKAEAKTKPQPKMAAAAPLPPPAYNPGFGYDQGAAGLNLNTVAPPASATPAPQRTAKANPPPARTTAEAPASVQSPTPGLTKRSVILFAPQAADPAQSALGAIKFLAGDLNAAMTAPASRVQIQAFGGNRGDKSSDARRLSLKRALAIRQVLIDDGVPAERIDVRAMGGADDSGPADRVDVYIKA